MAKMQSSITMGSAVLFMCLGAVLCTSTINAAASHTGFSRKLLDGVQLQKFDSLVSLKRTDGSDITPASLYNYLRDTFNDYFAQDGAGAAGKLQEGRVLAQGPPITTASQSKAATAKTSAPVVVDMSNSQLQHTLLAPPNADGAAKIEGPQNADAAPTFNGSGKLISAGGRRLSQAAAAAKKTAAPAGPAQQAAAGRTSNSQVVDMSNSRLQQTLLAPPNADGKAKIEGPQNYNFAPVFDGSGKLISAGGRKLSQAAGAAKKAAAQAAPVQQTATSQTTATKTNAPVVVDMSNSQLQKTLLAPPTANGQYHIEGPENTQGAPVFDGSGKLISGGRKLSQTAAGAAKQSGSAKSTVVDMTDSRLEGDLLAPPTANGEYHIEGPKSTVGAPIFDGSGRLISAGRKLSQAAAVEAKRSGTIAAPVKATPVKPAPAATTKTSAPIVVDMTGTALEGFMLSGRSPSALAKIEGPPGTAAAASTATFDGFGRPIPTSGR